MSKDKNIGLRLKEERKRLGKNQTDFASFCGFSRRTQVKYEQGESDPDELYLFKASELGVDIGYVLDGIKTNYDAVHTDISALPKAQRLLNNPELIDTIMVVNEVMFKTGMDLTDPLKFKQILSSLAEVDVFENQLSQKQLVEKVLVNLARKR